MAALTTSTGTVLYSKPTDISPETQLIDAVVNAIGNPQFVAQDVTDALMMAKEAFEKEGRHTGSLIAILNILPVVDELAKQIY